MNKRIQALFLAFLLLLSLAFGCKGKEAEPAAPANVAADGETFAFPENETDFGLLRTPGSQEAAYAYKAFFLPAQDGTAQPYVGDTMPYYEDGTYYIYYLKEGGDSYNHSIYLATTKDFVTYTEKDDVVLEASRAGGQDGWIGTGSVVKVKDTYYFFYTGHAFSDSYEFKEKILVAKGSSLEERFQGSPGLLRRGHGHHHPDRYRRSEQQGPDFEVHPVRGSYHNYL